MAKILGIDFSLTSPAYTLLTDNQVECYCVSSVKQQIDISASPTMRISIYSIEKYFETPYQRMEYLAEITGRYAEQADYVCMEDYSFGSVGMVFSIAEITGFVKYRLWKIGKPPHLVAPAQIKKWATGKGNANKEVMITNFIQKTGVNLLDILPLNKQKPFSSPISDIVDSYFIACFYRKLQLETTKDS